MELSWWNLRWDTIDFRKAKYQFEELKTDFKKIGLTLQKL